MEAALMYIDLVAELSEEDKIKITNYIHTYGINKNHYIGTEQWLQNWSHSKQKLYKFLGNSFIQEFPFQYEKDYATLDREIYSKLFPLEFKSNYHTFYVEVIKKLVAEKKMDSKIAEGFSHLTDVENFITDKIKDSIKYKKENCKKALQIQSGMKPMRAFSKIIEYFKDDFHFENFEEFRLQHSRILNDKIVKGVMCISIHPLDFLTMSDNSLNWKSCMSWVDDGCYHLGTVEMMNSNNVVCCYLKDTKKDFYFNKSQQTKDPLYSWNNKKWRVLAYVTKDIIMCGKSYPYLHQKMSDIVLEKIRTLAEQNLGWKYSFGPEIYMDMKHIDDEYKMENNRKWMRSKNTKKHNIIFDTKGMYNDMLNAHSAYYICYRNKVNHNKIISVSGKAPCLCCGETVLREDYDRENRFEYNDRYKDTGYVICEDCRDNFFTCNICEDPSFFDEFYTISVKTGNHLRRVHICEECFRKKVIKCPNCGRPMIISSKYIPEDYFLPSLNEDFKPVDFYEYKTFTGNDNHNDYFYICEECFPSFVDKFEKREYKYYSRKASFKCYTGDDVEKFRYENLQSAEYEEGMVVLERGYQKKFKNNLLF
jgi:hypothetical protein